MRNMDSDSDSDMHTDSDIDATSAAGGDQVASIDALAELFNRVTTNAYDYDAHVALISTLRGLGDLDALRQARETMSAVFPLTPDMWLAWIQDERRVAVEPTEKRQVLRLFGRAIGDYISIPVWLAYLEFAIEEYQTGVEDGTPWLTTKDIYAITQSADATVGLDFADSHQVWTLIKDVEIFDLQRQPTPEGIRRVRSMFHARLKTPHAEIDKTLEAYSPFESEFDGDNYVERLKTATEMVSKVRRDVQAREARERMLVESGYSTQEFLSYIAFEKAQPKGGDPRRIRTLFERAITRNCLDPALWDAYIVYSMAHDKFPTRLVWIVDRASRNCMQSAAIWCHVLRVKEAFRKPRSMLMEDYQRAISFVSAVGDLEGATDLAICRCEMEKRMLTWDADASESSLRAVFEESSAMLNAIPSSDREARLLRFWAREEAIRSDASNIDTARALYDRATKAAGNVARVWLEYAAFERTHGNVFRARSVYRQATIKGTDMPQRVHSDWLEFEMTWGNVETVYQAQDKILAARGKQGRFDYVGVPVDAAPLVDGISGSISVHESDAKKRLIDDLQDETMDKRVKHDHVTTATAHTNDVGVKTPTPAAVPEHKTAATASTEDESKHGKNTGNRINLSEYKVIPNANAGNMIYLSPLSSRTTEDAIRKTFGSYGKIVDLVLQPDEHGELEAFVEFVGVGPVQKLSGMAFEVAGTTVVPQRCRPSKMVWDFEQTEERTKIYVSNLPVHVDKVLIRTAFSRFGKIRDIRLVYRKSVAFAYIEFETDEAARESLKMDQKPLEPGSDRKMGVAISDPSRRKVREIDPRELYVANLPREFSEQDLEDLFGKHGPLRSVRLLLNNNGQSKCTAFVEYEDEAHARSALSLNGTSVGGRLLMVSISDPNVRKGQRVNEVAAPAGQRSGPSSSQPPKPKAQSPSSSVTSAMGALAFVPRAKARSRIEVRAPSTASNAQQQKQQRPQQQQPQPLPSSKTQDDFRRMMMGP